MPDTGASEGHVGPAPVAGLTGPAALPPAPSAPVAATAPVHIPGKPVLELPPGLLASQGPVRLPPLNLAQPPAAAAPVAHTPGAPASGAPTAGTPAPPARPLGAISLLQAQTRAAQLAQARTPLPVEQVPQPGMLFGPPGYAYRQYPPQGPQGTHERQPPVNPRRASAASLDSSANSGDDRAGTSVSPPIAPTGPGSESVEVVEMRPGRDGRFRLNAPTCSNCHTRTTPLWRRNEQGLALCNACGLFAKLHGRRRPISFKTDTIKPRNRLRCESNKHTTVRGGPYPVTTVAGSGAELAAAAAVAAGPKREPTPAGEPRELERDCAAETLASLATAGVSEGPDASPALASQQPPPPQPQQQPQPQTQQQAPPPQPQGLRAHTPGTPALAPTVLPTPGPAPGAVPAPQADSSSGLADPALPALPNGQVPTGVIPTPARLFVPHRDPLHTRINELSVMIMVYRTRMEEMSVVLATAEAEKAALEGQLSASRYVRDMRDIRRFRDR